MVQQIPEAGYHGYEPGGVITFTTITRLLLNTWSAADLTCLGDLLM